MPTLRKELNDSVFYLYARDPKTGEIVGPQGTGFLVARLANTAWPTAHHYAVSNWHVAVQGGASIIRFNTKDGGTRFLEYDPSQWLFEPCSDDLAAVDITADIRETDQIFVQSEASFLTQDIINEYAIEFGEDVFMIGMFASHHGGKRNIPAARFGNLSMLASPEAPITLENEAKRPAHLVDMRSRGGFSGSPVFIYRTPSGNLSSPTMHRMKDPHPTGYSGSNMRTRKEWFVGLMGIHCGQFWETIEVRKANSKNERRGDPIVEGDTLSVHGGMTIVAPAWRVTDLLNLEAFETMRRQREIEAGGEWNDLKHGRDHPS
jgi:hypothetical protein